MSAVPTHYIRELENSGCKSRRCDKWFRGEINRRDSLRSYSPKRTCRCKSYRNHHNIVRINLLSRVNEDLSPSPGLDHLLLYAG